MKTRKTLATALIICMIFALTIVGFVGCKPEEPNTPAPAAPADTLTIVVASDNATVDYTVEMSKVDTTKGVIGLFDYFKANTNFDYVGSEGPYGLFLTKVCFLEVKEKNDFICIYTSVEKDKDVSEYAQTIDYKGKKVTTSGLGVSSMHLEANAVVYFNLSSF